METKKVVFYLVMLATGIVLVVNCTSHLAYNTKVKKLNDETL